MPPSRPSSANEIQQRLEHWKLVFGAAQLSRPGPDVQERTIKNLVEHQQYVRITHFNDVALMELSHPINCSDYIQPACLPNVGLEISSLTHCYISGWGVTDVSKPKDTSDVLQEAKVNLIPTTICNSTAWYNMKIHYNNLCAGHEEGGIDTCQGDSGGPLMCREERSERYWVIGVTSWGPMTCAEVRKPGVFISTQLYMDWITAITKENLYKATHRPVMAEASSCVEAFTVVHASSHAMVLNSWDKAIKVGNHDSCVEKNPCYSASLDRACPMGDDTTFEDNSPEVVS
ncbi:PREDICTED: acrosin-like [Thamnophis sirtalis]|uniref:Acrosin n=1 Tax=Thamnophis sirtalis TaxID=35019 RepID=A0A6I9Y5R9_9SAUR|nr:PREDICTED: acrosin-like [Thamnophis sirtalis]